MHAIEERQLLYALNISFVYYFISLYLILSGYVIVPIDVIF